MLYFLVDLPANGPMPFIVRDRGAMILFNTPKNDGQIVSESSGFGSDNSKQKNKLGFSGMMSSRCPMNLLGGYSMHM
jgi:hypothetical protein